MEILLDLRLIINIFEIGVSEWKQFSWVTSNSSVNMMNLKRLLCSAELDRFLFQISWHLCLMRRKLLDSQNVYLNLLKN
jgi:hypothetical protein